MKTVHKSVLIWHSPQQMFDLVSDVSQYPAFLPWCDHATVLETHSDGVTAEIGLAFGGIHQRFVTRNIHVAGRQVDVRLVKGPFSKLDGAWTFSPVGTDGNACKVALALEYGFKSTALSMLVGPVFDKIASSLVDAFVRRADVIYV
ncbi:MAG: type II toxin-antitoxin system RatA family toxin [Burkholderiaceae bacterium]